MGEGTRWPAACAIRRDAMSCLRAASFTPRITRIRRPGDRIRATFDLVFLTGWAPDDSQQQPLRPGSACMPLAEAPASTGKPE